MAEDQAEAYVAAFERERDVFRSQLANLQAKLEDATRTREQMSINFKWVLSQVDKIAAVVCPEFIGTWQQRGQQASYEVYQLAQKYSGLQAKLEAAERALAKACGIVEGT